MGRLEAGCRGSGGPEVLGVSHTGSPELGRQAWRCLQGLMVLTSGLIPTRIWGRVCGYQ